MESPGQGGKIRFQIVGVRPRVNAEASNGSDLVLGDEGREGVEVS